MAEKRDWKDALAVIAGIEKNLPRVPVASTHVLAAVFLLSIAASVLWLPVDPQARRQRSTSWKFAGRAWRCPPGGGGSSCSRRPGPLGSLQKRSVSSGRRFIASIASRFHAPAAEHFSVHMPAGAGQPGAVPAVDCSPRSLKSSRPPSLAALAALITSMGALGLLSCSSAPGRLPNGITQAWALSVMSGVAAVGSLVFLNPYADKLLRTPAGGAGPP